MRAAALMLACVALACGAPRTGSLEDRFAALKRADELTMALSTHDKATAMRAIYDALFIIAPTTPLRDLSPQDLAWLYRAAALTAFHTADERRVLAMQPVLAELEARGLASPHHDTKMYEAFVTARMLPQARAFASQHALLALEPIPETRDAVLVDGQPTAWLIDPHRRALERRSVDLQRTAQVVVVSHPACHFWANAWQALEADPVLAKVFAAHAIQLAPQDARIDFDALQAWNRAHPAWPTLLTFRRDEWPMLDTWSTPTFYFFQAGALVAKVEGWPEGGRRAELVAALTAIGLLPSQFR